MKVLTFLISLLLCAVILAFVCDSVLLYNQRTTSLLSDRLVARKYSLTEQDRLVIDEACEIMAAENQSLYRMKYFSIICTVVLTVLSVLVFFRSGKRMQRFDGLVIMIVSCLTAITLLPGLNELGRSYYNGHNALMNLRTVVLVTTMASLPLVLFFAGRLNHMEVQRGLHGSKWITGLAYSFGTIVLIFGLILLVALLLTPDLGGHWG